MVVIKGRKYRVIKVADDADDIELIPPTEGEIRGCVDYSPVLVKVPFICAYSQRLEIVAILPKEEKKEARLPEKIPSRPIFHTVNSDTLRDAIEKLYDKQNEIIDYLKSKE